MTGEKDRYTTTEKLWKLDDTTLTTPKHDEMVLDLLDPEYVKILFPDLAAKGVSFSIRSETPLTQHNGFIVGYLDIEIVIAPVWIDGRPQRVFGQCNASRADPYESNIYIEVKPSIQSFGQTLRQLNTYRDVLTRRYKERPVMRLYTTEARFDAAFESQGIRVIHPAPRG